MSQKMLFQPWTPGTQVHVSTENDDTFVTVGLTTLKTIDELPSELRSWKTALLEGISLDKHLPPAPEWVDLDRVKKGQSFSSNYISGFALSFLVAFGFLFTFPLSSVPFVFKGNTHTPEKARTRYRSITKKILSLIETEFWNPSSEGYRTLVSTKSIHANVTELMKTIPLNELIERTKLDNVLKEDVGGTCCLYDTLMTDFRDYASKVYSCKVPLEHFEWFSQARMVIQQYSTLGLVLVRPECFGMKNASKEELSNFAHMWGYIGYLLGIKDEHNLCSGDLDTVARRCEQLTQCFIKPSVVQVNKEWEHMARSIIQGIGEFSKTYVKFEAYLRYLYYLLDLNSPSLAKCTGWVATVQFYAIKWLMLYGQVVPGFWSLFNYLTMKYLRKVVN